MESGIRGNPRVIYTYIARDHWLRSHLTDSAKMWHENSHSSRLDAKDQDSRYFTIKRAICPYYQLPTEHTVLFVESQRHDLTEYIFFQHFTEHVRTDWGLLVEWISFLLRSGALVEKRMVFYYHTMRVRSPLHPHYLRQKSWMNMPRSAWTRRISVCGGGV